MSKEINGVFNENNLENCKIYGQRIDIDISENSRIFIYRTPTANEFDMAKKNICDILDQYYHYYKQSVPIKNVDNIFITIRGNEGFIDIEIENQGINDEAWIGIDLR